MNENEQMVWRILNHAAAKCRGDEELAVELVQSSLELLSKDDLALYAQTFERLRDRLIGGKLLGVLFLANGSMDDEDLLDFAAWVMMQGEEVYEAAVENPDSLASILHDGRDDYGEHSGDMLARLPYTLYQEMTGEDLPVTTALFVSADAFDAEFDYSNEFIMEQNFPKLWDKLGGFHPDAYEEDDEDEEEEEETDDAENEYTQANDDAVEIELLKAEAARLNIDIEDDLKDKDPTRERPELGN